jgi:hypothetical protein
MKKAAYAMILPQKAAFGLRISPNKKPAAKFVFQHWYCILQLPNNSF